MNLDLLTSHIIESSNDVIISISLDGNINYCNYATVKNYGYAKEELLDKPYHILLPQEKLAELAKIMESLMFGEYIDTLESIRLSKDQKRIKVSVVFSPVKNNMGKLIGFSIIERRLTEYRKAESRSQALIETAPDAMVIVNNCGQIILVNGQAEKLFGYTRNELLGQDIEILIPDRFLDKHSSHRKSFFSNPHTRGMGRDMELWGKKKNGEEFPVEVSLGPLRTEETLLVSAAIRDISERKYAEEKFKRLLESAPDPMVIVDQNGAITLINGQTENLFGYSRDELLGQQIELLIPGKFRAQHPEYRKKFFQNPKLRPMGMNLELFGLKKNGEEFPVEISLSPIQEKDSMLVSAAIRDISDRKYIKQLEQKNRELEQFAYIASHDLQEPLHTVKSFVQLLKTDYHNQLDHQAQQFLSFIFQSTSRMEKLIYGLLEYSRIGKQKQLSLVDCNKLLKEVIDDLHAKIVEAKATIHVDHLPTIDAYKTELWQLFQNLLSNAIKFRKQDVDPIIHISCIQNNNESTFSIQDNGIGIQSKFFDKIFIIFQRLHFREDFEGTGIGLAQCKKIVELHGGKIWLESNPGMGSNFLFTI
ncbi:MAG: PAS domain-containing sensor histidine kinase [Thalassobius sp.]|nr:PAS domain-containing sensor histidine kinase [Thalassovita sp.]